ncbi:MAG: ABC transporter permease [Deltaproteobacteria bacterium]|nr:ABC transporter permease [Deltaproteobacteria bacterium]
MTEHYQKNKIKKIYISVILDMFSEAWISLKSYKLRSFLTILGIVIGVMAVVDMVALGEGVQRKVNERFAGLGSNLLVIRPGFANTRGVNTGNIQTLTYDDAAAISVISQAAKVSYANNTAGQAVYNKKNIGAGIYGVPPSYFEVMNFKIEKGAFFTEKDSKLGSSYALIGKNVCNELFGEENAVGKVIRIKNIPLTIIGVIRESGSVAFINPDDNIFIPFKTFSRRFSGATLPKSVHRIVLNVAKEEYLDYVSDKITQLLRERHNIRKQEENDFRLINMAELVNTVKETTRLFTILLAAIAAISLLVGSIGIMNMMLVSVTERTKEIGLRKALGAQDKTIMQQFLFEAVLISLFGSFIGLILGVTIALLLGRFFNIDMMISFSSVFLSIAVSVAVGISAGLFPAIKASRLNPIEALRYE